MNLPTLNHEITKKLFFEDLLSSEDLETILSLEHLSLVQDLENIINFYLEKKEEIINEDIYSNNAIVYALFILKEVNAENQLDLVMKVLELDEYSIDIWFSDFYTEYYWSLIVFFGENHLESLKERLKDIKVDSFSNEQIASAIIQIYFRNEEKHEIIRAYWTELLEFYNTFDIESDNLDPTYLAFFTSYVYCPNDYQISLIKSLYDKDIIDESVNGSFEELFEIEEDYRELATIFDIQNDLEKYYNEVNNPYIFEKYIDEVYKNDNQQTTIANKEPKINRNDNCPCGSGKKYKKCCINE
jgi:hypothetical protein